MINIIENNYKEADKDTVYKTVCPHCRSVFTFCLEDLKFIEKTLNGKRIINCPCCGTDFDTVKADTEVFVDEDFQEKHCKSCTSYVCDGLTSSMSVGCELAKEAIIGKVGIVTKKPDTSFMMPFYHGDIQGVGDIMFVVRYNTENPCSSVLNVGDMFTIVDIKFTEDMPLWIGEKK